MSRVIACIEKYTSIIIVHIDINNLHAKTHLLFFTCSKSDGIMRDANKGDKSWFVPFVCPYVNGFCCILTVQ